MRKSLQKGRDDFVVGWGKLIMFIIHVHRRERQHGSSKKKPVVWVDVFSIFRRGAFFRFQPFVFFWGVNQESVPHHGAFDLLPACHSKENWVHLAWCVYRGDHLTLVICCINGGEKLKNYPVINVGTIISHYKDPFTNLFQYFHQFMSLVGFVATSHLRLISCTWKTAPMIDLKFKRFKRIYVHYMHCVEYIFLVKILDGLMDASAFFPGSPKKNCWVKTPGAIMTLATKNHMVFRINQSLSTNRSGTGLLKTEDGESNLLGISQQKFPGKSPTPFLMPRSFPRK